MPAKRVEITIPMELFERIEVARGHEPRASWIKRALESALDFEDRLPRPPTRKSIPAEDWQDSPSDPTFAKPTTAMARQERLNKAKAGKR